MKKITNIVFAAFFVAAGAVSCTKENYEQSGTNLVPMSLNVNQEVSDKQKETRTSMDSLTSGFKVLFSSTDQLFVYGKNGASIKGTQFTTTQTGRKESKLFNTDSWPEGYTPIYAVSTTDKSDRQSCTSDGKITMLVNNENQALDWSYSYASNTAGHLGAVSDGSTVLKNVCGLLKFRLKKNDITKILVSGLGGEALGGWINVDYASMDTDSVGFFTADADAVRQLAVTVGTKLNNKARAGNCIPCDTSFFISILPGSYSGLKFTLITSDFKVATRTVGALTIKRGQMRTLGGKAYTALDSGLSFEDAELPETFTLILDKNQKAGKGKWPFKEKMVEAASQQTTGDSYTYEYTDSVTGATFELPFVLCAKYGSEKPYTYTYCFNFAKGSDYIKFPAVKDRRISSIYVSFRNSGGRNITIGTTEGGDDVLAATLIPKDGASTLNFTSGVLDQSDWYMSFVNQTSNYFDTLSVTYTSDLSDNIVLDCTDADNFRYDNGGVTSSLPARSAATIGDSDFWLEDYPELKFHGEVRKWTTSPGSVLNFTSKYVKLPEIENYSLDSLEITYIHPTSKRTYHLTDAESIADGHSLSNSGSIARGDVATLRVSEGTPVNDARYIYCTSEAGIRFKLYYSSSSK